MKKHCSKHLDKYILIAVIAVIAIIGSKTFLVDVYRVNGNSMIPGFKNDELVIVHKSKYGYRMPRNIYEIPLIGQVSYLLSSDSIVANILSKNDSFKYIRSSLPTRNDIVAFNIPGNNNYRAIKRCVALPGETYPDSCWFSSISPVIPYKGMRIKKAVLSEACCKYLSAHRDFEFDPSDSSFIATDNFIFVIGDNKAVSEDSRRWGPIPLNLVIGKVVLY